MPLPPGFEVVGQDPNAGLPPGFEVMDQPDTTMSQAFQKTGVEPSKFQMAKQAIGETLSENLPGGVGNAVEMGRSIPWTASPRSFVMRATAEALPQTGGGLLAQGVAGPVMEGLGVAAKPIAASAKEWVPSLASKLSRIELPWAKRAFERGSKVASKMGIENPQAVIEPFISTIKTTLKEARTAIGKRLGEAEDAVLERVPGRVVPTADIGSRLDRGLQKAGFDLPGMQDDVKIPISGNTKEILSDFKNMQGGAPEKVSPILGPKGEKIVTPAVPQTPAVMTFKSALNLRRKMDRTLEFIESGSLKVGSVEEHFLKGARKELNERLLSVDPLFKRVNDAAAKVFQAYSALSKDMLSGKEETIATRISRVFQKGTMERRLVERLDTIAKQAGADLDSVLDIMTAQKFKPKINPAVSKAFYNTGGGVIPNVAKVAAGEGGAALTGHAAAGPVLAGAALAGSSPRLNFEAMQLAKKLAENGISATGKQAIGQGAVKIPPALKRLLMRKNKAAMNPDASTP